MKTVFYLSAFIQLTSQLVISSFNQINDHISDDHDGRGHYYLDIRRLIFAYSGVQPSEIKTFLMQYGLEFKHQRLLHK